MFKQSVVWVEKDWVSNSSWKTDRFKRTLERSGHASGDLWLNRVVGKSSLHLFAVRSTMVVPHLMCCPWLLFSFIDGSWPADSSAANLTAYTHMFRFLPFYVYIFKYLRVILHKFCILSYLQIIFYYLWKRIDIVNKVLLVRQLVGIIMVFIIGLHFGQHLYDWFNLEGDWL